MPDDRTTGLREETEEDQARQQTGLERLSAAVDAARDGRPIDRC